MRDLQRFAAGARIALPTGGVVELHIDDAIIDRTARVRLTDFWDRRLRPAR